MYMFSPPELQVQLSKLHYMVCTLNGGSELCLVEGYVGAYCIPGMPNLVLQKGESCTNLLTKH